MANVVDLMASGDAVTSAYDRNITHFPETFGERRAAARVTVRHILWKHGTKVPAA